jgi:predicted PurR-regulated permease PerM
LATFLEESQDRLRVNFGLGLGEQSLAFLTVYARDTHALHAWLDEMIIAAQQGRAAAEWPLPPVSLSALPALDSDWHPAWPGPQARDVVDAETYVPVADQSAWRELMIRGGLTLFRKHAAWIAALRQAKDNDNDKNSSSPLVGEIQRAWRSTLSLEERKQALIFALALESQAKAGQSAAHELLGVAGVSADTPISGETLSDVVAKVEDTVRGSVDDLPTRLGGWAKAGLSSYDAVLSLAINLLLIPIYSFFLLLGMPRIRTFIKHYLPAIHKPQIVRITREIEKVVAAFFRGRLLICTICSLVGCLGFLIIAWFGVHVPYGMLWGIGIGMATAIPLAGVLFLIPAVALTMMAPNAGLMDLVAVVAVYGVVQGLEACLLSAIMGREVELHPVTLIVALLLCSKLLGILGLILAVPIAASFRILLREYFWPRMEAWSIHGSWVHPASASALPAVPAEHPPSGNSA